MHFHLTDDQFLVGGFVLILGIVIAISAFFEKRNAKAQQFRNYFCAEYNNSLLPDGSLEEVEDSLAERPSRF